MKKDLREYYPNRMIKHLINSYSNGECCEIFYTQKGIVHRKNFPAFQEWYLNEFMRRSIFFYNGSFHNINTPADTHFFKNGKILAKKYAYNDEFNTKLTWMNLIKNI